LLVAAQTFLRTVSHKDLIKAQKRSSAELGAAKAARQRERQGDSTQYFESVDSRRTRRAREDTELAAELASADIVSGASHFQAARRVEDAAVAAKEAAKRAAQQANAEGGFKAPALDSTFGWNRK
jgi:multidrug resistance efflux pump